MKLCSACLLGIRCRYDGKDKANRDLISLSKKEVFVPICPEQLGGLSTPREPSEKRGRKVFSRSGKDMTENFKHGAEIVLEIAKRFHIKTAILKQRSAACGCGEIYDGTFSGRIVKGDGVTASLLKKNKIRVIPETKIKVLMVICILVIASLAHSLEGYADTVTLKNKRKVEGVIQQETEEFIILDMGFGTTTIPKGDIENVRNTPKEEDDKLIKAWEKRSLEMGGKEQRRIDVLAHQLRGVKKKRFEVMKYRNRYEGERHRVTNITRELSHLYAKFENLNNKLRKANANDIIGYNTLVAEVNAASASMGRMKEESIQSENRGKELGEALSKYVGEYRDALQRLDESFEQTDSSAAKVDLGDDDKLFYRSMGEEINKLKRDFKYRETEYRKKGSSIIVEVMLNNRIKSKMIVDTGASLVLISRKMADELRIYTSAVSGKIQCILADGSKVEAQPITLQSVGVGSSIVRNVRGAIIDGQPAPGVDGLLGMTFLGNFIVRIDAKGNKLILEEFRPT